MWEAVDIGLSHDLTSTHVEGSLPLGEEKETPQHQTHGMRGTDDFQTQEAMVSGFPKTQLKKEKKIRTVQQIASPGEL